MASHINKIEKLLKVAFNQISDKKLTSSTFTPGVIYVIY